MLPDPLHDVAPQPMTRWISNIAGDYHIRVGTAPPPSISDLCTRYVATACNRSRSQSEANTRRRFATFVHAAMNHIYVEHVSTSQQHDQHHRDHCQQIAANFAPNEAFAHISSTGHALLAMTPHHHILSDRIRISIVLKPAVTYACLSSLSHQRSRTSIHSIRVLAGPFAACSARCSIMPRTPPRPMHAQL